MRIAWAWAASARKHLGTDQVLDRVVAEEGGEEDRDRRRVGRPLGGGGRDARGPASPSAIAAGRVAASPTISRVKKIPIESTWAEFWKVWFIPPPAPRSAGGRLFITAARLGEANIPIEIPLKNRISGEDRSRRSRSAAASAGRS